MARSRKHVNRRKSRKVKRTRRTRRTRRNVKRGGGINSPKSERKNANRWKEMEENRDLYNKIRFLIKKPEDEDEGHEILFTTSDGQEAYFTYNQSIDAVVDKKITPKEFAENWL